jgi:hypothetical protein
MRLPKIRTNTLSLYTAILLAALLIFCRLHEQKKTNPIGAITWDVYGYYLYLPSTFIYNDPGLEERDWIDSTAKMYSPSPYLYQFGPALDNKQVNTYPMGLAGVYAPGFFIAHAWAKLFSYPADGFSPPYQWSLVLTALFYASLGVFLLRIILLKFFSDKLSALLLLIGVCGTNFFFHAGLDGTMPHNFMFVFNCLILLLTMRWHETFKLKYAILLGFFLGWATISRPTELIWILVPLLWGIHSIGTFLNKCRILVKHFLQVMAFALTLVLTGLPQLLYWKWTTGSWFSYNHAESFSFYHPYTQDFLFSYKKGWLIYTPVMVFALFGFSNLYRFRRDLFGAFFVFTVVNIYVLSSWDCWWYAASFSQRPMVESYPMLMIPMGFFVLAVSRRSLAMRTGVALLMTGCVALNMFQTWQASNGILEPERMTEAYYWKIFLKTGVSRADRQALLDIDRHQYDHTFEGNPSDFYKKEILFHDFETPNADTDPKYVVDTMGFESRHCLLLDSIRDFSPGVREKFTDLTGKGWCWVRVSLQVYPTLPFEVSNSSLAIALESKGRIIDYRSWGLSDIKAIPGRWNAMSYDYLTAIPLHSDDQVLVHYWNSGKKHVYIDNLKVEVWEPKH